MGLGLQRSRWSLGRTLVVSHKRMVWFWQGSGSGPQDGQKKYTLIFGGMHSLSSF
jgi:hypothetical protein